jgi:hypothetical protein
MDGKPSRLWQLFLMLPFFLVGVALPVYFFGFSGDGPLDLSGPSYSPVPVAAPPADYGPPQDSPENYDPIATRHSGRSGLVTFVRGIFESFVDSYIAPGVSPAAIKLTVFVLLFVLVFLIIRVVLAFSAGVVGSFVGFLIHKAAAPMFMGFLAVGSTWGIHQTVAEEFGMTWAATTVSLTAAIASLFALAGVKIR